VTDGEAWPINTKNPEPDLAWRGATNWILGRTLPIVDKNTRTSEFGFSHHRS